MSLCPRSVLAVLLMLISAAISTIEPAQLTDPVSQAVSSGSSVSLNYTADGSMNRQWLRGDIFSSLSLLNTSSGGLAVVDQSSSSRSLLSVASYHQLDHGGQYTGLASYGSGHLSLMTCPATLSHAMIGTNFTLEPEDVQVIAGESVVLRCSPPMSNPPAFVFWRKIEDGSVYTASLSGTLYLSSVSQMKAGRYQCIASNSVTGTMIPSKSAQLTVTAGPVPSPRLIVSPSDTVATVGQQVELECASSGGLADVVWQPLPASASVLQPSGFLRFSAVTVADSGEYTCTVGNTAASATLSVHVPPTITITPDTITASLGDNITLKCSPAVVGTTLDVSWQSQGVILQQDYNVNTSTLEYTLPEDRDEVWIECVARNSAGCDHDTAIVNMPLDDDGSASPVPHFSATLSSPSPSPSPSPPPPPPGPQITVIIGTPSPIVLTAGESTNLSCFVLITPPPSGSPFIFWERNGTIVDNSPPVMHLDPVFKSTLSVTLPAEYSCIVMILGGGGQVHFVRESATVISAHSPSPSPETPLSNTSTPTNTTLPSLPHSASHFAPHITSLTISPSLTTLPTSPSSPTQASLISSLLSTVAAGQSSTLLGSISSSMLSPTTPPSPSISQVHASTAPSPSVTPPDNVLLFIQPPVGGMVLLEGSQINITCSVRGPAHVAVHWSQDTAKLPADTQYYGSGVVVSVLQLSPVSAKHHGVFVCTASNPVSHSNTSGSISVNVIATAPSLPPSAVMAQWMQDGSLRVQWQPPPPAGIKSHLLGYKLTWGPSGSALSLSARVYVSATDQEHIITGLSADGEYTVQVWAYSLGGDGPPTTVDVSSTSPTVTTDPPTSSFVTTDSPSFPPVSPSPTPSDSTLNCTSSSPFTASVAWQGNLEHPQQLRYECELAGVTSTVTVLSGASEHELKALLPDCFYNVTLTQTNATPAHCTFRTPPDPTANGSLSIGASWRDSGDLVFQWTLPSSLAQYSDLAVVEVRFGQNGDWLIVTSGQHIRMTLDPYMDHVVDVRVRLGQWVGYRTQGFFIPSLSRPSPSVLSSGPSTIELVLTYGVGVVILVIACVVLVVLVLVLKHVQSQRRERDKDTDHRQRARDNMTKKGLARSTSQRSSLKLKRPSPSTAATNSTYI